MNLYADLPARRTRQLLGDLLLVLWVIVWVKLALVVRDATLALAAPGRQIEDAATGLAGRLRDAGAAFSEVPLVGDEARAPFDGAATAAGQIADAGAAQVEAVQSLAFWLGLSVAAVPILLVALAYLPLRWRFVRTATAGRRFMDSADGGDRLDLFALRAMVNQPVHRLATVTPDPVEAWCRGDADVVRALARMELRAMGLRPPS